MRYSIRSIFWTTLVIAVSLGGWNLDRQRMAARVAEAEVAYAKARDLLNVELLKVAELERINEALSRDLSAATAAVVLATQVRERNANEETASDTEDEAPKKVDGRRR